MVLPDKNFYTMAESKDETIALLGQDISYIKRDIDEIKTKLDTKYVSHETYESGMKSMNRAISWIIAIAVFIATPIYGAVITLMFKVFSS